MTAFPFNSLELNSPCPSTDEQLLYFLLPSLKTMSLILRQEDAGLAVEDACSSTNDIDRIGFRVRQPQPASSRDIAADPLSPYQVGGIFIVSPSRPAAQDHSLKSDNCLGWPFAAGFDYIDSRHNDSACYAPRTSTSPPCARQRFRSVQIFRQWSYTLDRHVLARHSEDFVKARLADVWLGSSSTSAFIHLLEPAASEALNPDQCAFRSILLQGTS